MLEHLFIIIIIITLIFIECRKTKKKVESQDFVKFSLYYLRSWCFRVSVSVCAFMFGFFVLNITIQSNPNPNPKLLDDSYSIYKISITTTTTTKLLTNTSIVHHLIPLRLFFKLLNIATNRIESEWKKNKFFIMLTHSFIHSSIDQSVFFSFSIFRSKYCEQKQYNCWILFFRVWWCLMFNMKLYFIPFFSTFETSIFIIRICFYTHLFWWTNGSHSRWNGMMCARAFFIIYILFLNEQMNEWIVFR